MLLRVDEFCDRVRMGLRPLVADLQEATGRYGQAESDAWSASLPRMADVLRRTKLGETHIRVGSRAGVSLEYRLPASSSWADAVLLGRGQAGAKALFFELKDWATQSDRPGPRAGLVAVREWSRIWNYAPEQDYSLFIQAPAGSEMGDDPLCEVGCPYVVRGFDYDNLGILWGADLLWRNGWTVDLKRVHESAWKKTLSAAKKSNQAGRNEIVLRLRRAYRILLSRAIHGVDVWFEDPETRLRVSGLLAAHQ